MNQLRDYKTGTWVGGDPTCLHPVSPRTSVEKQIRASTLVGSKDTQGHQQQGQIGACRHCGAVRQDRQIGLEATADCHGAFTGKPCGQCYVCTLVAVGRECWRVLRDDGTFWLVIADSYSGGLRVGHGTRQGYLQQTNRGMNGANDPQRPQQPLGLRGKNLLGIPWRVAFALQAAGWTLRADVIWAKKNPMPESVHDRPTKAHEYVFLLSKRPQYFYDAIAIQEDSVASSHRGGWHTMQDLVAHAGAKNDGFGARFAPTGTRNLRSVMWLASEPTVGTHYAKMPTALAETCLKAGTSEAGVCPRCAAPWRRLVTTHRLRDGQYPVQGTFSQPDEPFRIPANGVGHWRYSTQHTTQGWIPGCRCAAGAPVPARVFDPFCGSGTTLLTARTLGRHGLGCDLSWPYLHGDARHRLGLDALQAWEHGAAARPERFDDLPLFGGQETGGSHA